MVLRALDLSVVAQGFRSRLEFVVGFEIGINSLIIRGLVMTLVRAVAGGCGCFQKQGSPLSTPKYDNLSHGEPPKEDPKSFQTPM